MKRFFAGLASAAVFLSFLMIGVLSSCSGKSKGDNDIPENFMTMGDAGRMEYMMSKVSADSVARFLCDASLGRLEWARIDSLPNAKLYAYEHYRDEEAIAIFDEEFDRYASSLPLTEKRKIYVSSGKSSSETVGYDLGLEYVGYIREHDLKVAEVEKEVSDFRTACASDPDTYKRFVKGFRVVLEADHGHDFPEDIYQKFSKLEVD